MKAAVRHRARLARTSRQLLERTVRAYVEECSAARTAARVSELAQRFETHRSYLSRAAASVLGRQLRLALREEQLRIADELLRTTELRVEDVAVRAAFGTPSTFYRVFRKMLGMGPSEYRKASKR